MLPMSLALRDGGEQRTPYQQLGAADVIGGYRHRKRSTRSFFVTIVQLMRRSAPKILDAEQEG